MALESSQDFSRLRLVDACQVAVVPNDHFGAVRRKIKGSDGVGFDDIQFFLFKSIPKAKRTIRSARGNELAITRPGKRLNGAFMTVQGREGVARGGLPNV